MTTAFLAEVERIRSHPDNPRTELRGIDGLAASIREHGLIQPVMLAPDPDRGEGYWLLHAGHRRLAAFRKLGFPTIPANLREIPASRTIEVMMVENLQRDDLTPIEIGKGLIMMRDAHNPPLTQVDIGRRLGKSGGWVHQMILFAELGEEESAAMAAGELSWAEATETAREVKASRGGRVHAKVERSDDRASRGWYLAHSHPLAANAKLVCDLHGHLRGSGRRLGNVACGACWEATIRADERGGVAYDELLGCIDGDVDRVIVAQMCDRNAPNVSGNPAERLEALRQMLAAGLTPGVATARLGVVGDYAVRMLTDLERIEAARVVEQQRRVS